MKAAVIRRRGGPNVLETMSLSEPEPGAGQVRVRVAAAAVNPVDIKTRSGFLSDIALTFPAVLGWDVSGVIENVGAGVKQWRAGDHVIAMLAQPVRGLGTYAEQVIVNSELLAPAPSTLPLLDAAAIPLAGATAWQALDCLGVDSGIVLVTGGVGAVGGIFIQLAKLRGLQVCALVDERDRHAALELGADETIHRGEFLPAAIVDGVLDTAGVATSIATVRDGGAFVSIEDTPQPPPERGIEPRKSFVNENGAQLARISRLVDDRKVKIRVAEEYPLEKAAAAHQRFESRGVRGKILLTP